MIDRGATVTGHPNKGIVSGLHRTAQLCVRQWKPMALWTLLVYLAVSSLLSPLIAAAIRLGLFRGGRTVVGNDELLTWIFSPTGFLYGFITVFTVLAASVIRYAGLFQIVSDDVTGIPVSVRIIARQMISRLPSLFRLCSGAIAAAFVLLLPYAAGMFLIYRNRLGGFDINYYLEVQPVEWTQALVAATIWNLLFFLLAGMLLLRGLPALPAFLAGERSVRQAVRNGWALPGRQILRLAGGLAILAILWAATRSLLQGTILLFFTYAIETIRAVSHSLRLTALLAGGWLFTSWMIGTIISFAGFSLCSTWLTLFHADRAQQIPTAFTSQRLPPLRKTASLLVSSLTLRRLLAAAVSIATAGLLTSLFIIGGPTGVPDVKVITHRANALGAPENSLPALQNSIRAGADMAEIDVQLTADGHVVVLHDADLMRVAGDPRRLARLTLDEVRSLQLHTDQPLAPNQLRVPLLSEMLDAARGRIGLLIELKQYGFDPALLEKTVRVIRKHDMAAEVQLMSLSAEAVRQAAIEAPEIRRGYLALATVGNLQALAVDFLALFHRKATPHRIRTAHAAGQCVYAWTVNRTEDIVGSVESGVDGIITDEPLRARAVLDELASLTRAERLLVRTGLVLIDGQALLREILDRESPDAYD